MGRVWDFKDQLLVGDAGARLFQERWEAQTIPHADPKGPDFVDALARCIELKTDTYPMSKTPNFFMERWSDVGTRRPGGPWQAFGKGCNLFVYLFLADRVWFVFDDLPALLARLDSLTPGLPAKHIRNKGWVTEGYAVSRLALSDLYKEVALDLQ